MLEQSTTPTWSRADVARNVGRSTVGGGRPIEHVIGCLDIDEAWAAAAERLRDKRA